MLMYSSINRQQHHNRYTVHMLRHESAAVEIWLQALRTKNKALQRDMCNANISIDTVQVTIANCRRSEETVHCRVSDVHQVRRPSVAVDRRSNAHWGWQFNMSEMQQDQDRVCSVHSATLAINYDWWQNSDWTNTDWTVVENTFHQPNVVMRKVWGKDDSYLKEQTKSN